MDNIMILLCTDLIKYISYLVIIMEILIIITNLIVEWIKDMVYLKDKPTRIVTNIVGILATLCCFFAMLNMNSIKLEWYYIIAAIVVGIGVGNGAINGFDHLYGKYLDRIKQLLSDIVNKEEKEN